MCFDLSREERAERAQSPQRRACDERSEEPVGAEDLIPDKPASTTSHRRTSETQFFGNVRLSRQSLCDLKWWRSLEHGDGQEVHLVPQSISLHSDALEVGYSGTLGFETSAASPGLWEARGFWGANDRQTSSTLRKLRAVRLRLSRSFAEDVSAPHIQQILLHEDTAAVMTILNAMVSDSRPMMSELPKLHALLRALRVELQAHWLPSAVNRFEESPSRK